VFRRLIDSQIEDGFQIGNNRIHEAPNQQLKYGPDLGGVAESSGAIYLPAHRRYSGRSYIPIQAATWEHLDRGKVTALIMSGLYGIFDAYEFIQEYDIHLTDTDKEAGVNLSAIWTEPYTQTLAAYVDRSYKGRPVKIINLLCDADYVASVQWDRLPVEKCSVLHLSSASLYGKQLLPCAGTIANAILQEPKSLEEMQPIDQGGKEYDLSDFGLPPPGLPPVKVRFESRIKIGTIKPEQETE
jgi:hypothetical protein